MGEPQQPKVAVVTGASAGVGKAAARQLALMGWRVIGIGRNPERSAAALAEIRRAAPSAQVDMIVADLALMRDVARAAEAIQSQTSKIHALLNNAGGVTAELTFTDEGNEATFAGNHLGHFLLTDRLLPELSAAAPARIISVSSTGHEMAPPLDWGKLQMTENYLSGSAYCSAKLMNILFTREAARRFAPLGIIAHAMHPGVVDSNFVSHCEPGMQAYMNSIKERAVTPEAAADTLVWLATSDEAGQSTGGYFHQRQAIPAAPAAQNPEDAARLWVESEKLIEKAGYPTHSYPAHSYPALSQVTMAPRSS